MNQTERIKIGDYGERIGISKLKEWGFKIHAQGKDAYPHDVIASLGNETFCINIKFATKMFGVQRSAIRNLVNSYETGSLLFVDPDGKCALFSQVITDKLPLSRGRAKIDVQNRFNLAPSTFEGILKAVKSGKAVSESDYIRDAIRRALREDGLL